MPVITNAQLAESYHREMKTFFPKGFYRKVIAERIKHARTDFYEHYIEHGNLDGVSEQGMGRRTINHLEYILQEKTHKPIKKKEEVEQKHFLAFLSYGNVEITLPVKQ